MLHKKCLHIFYFHFDEKWAMAWLDDFILKMYSSISGFSCFDRWHMVMVCGYVILYMKYNTKLCIATMYIVFL